MISSCWFVDELDEEGMDEEDEEDYEGEEEEVIFLWILITVASSLLFLSINPVTWLKYCWYGLEHYPNNQ